MANVVQMGAQGSSEGYAGTGAGTAVGGLFAAPDMSKTTSQEGIGKAKRDLKHLPASQDLEEGLPEGTPAGRPFFWTNDEVVQFFVSLKLDHCVERAKVAEVDGVTMMSMTEDEGWDLGMKKGEFDLMMGAIRAVIQARTASKQECLQLMIGDKHQKLGSLVAAYPVVSILISLVVTIAFSCGIPMLGGVNSVAGFIPMNNDFLSNNWFSEAPA